MTSEKVLMGGDFNGHVGSDMGGLKEVNGGGGGLGIGQVNEGRIRLLDWAVGKTLHLMSTYLFPGKEKLTYVIKIR